MSDMVTRAELLDFLATAGSASGSLGAYTVSRNRAGLFVRDRVTPAQPGTIKQLTANDRWWRVATDWRTWLTDAQRTSWAVYARNVPLRDRLGSVRHITGYQHFVRANYLRRIAHLTQRRDAPTVFNLGRFTPMRAKCFASPTRAALQLSWTETDDFASEPGSIIFVYVTVAYPSTINSFKPPRNYSRYIAGIATPPLPCPMRSSAATGDHVFWAVRVQRWDGRLSYLQRSMVVVEP